MVRTTLFGAVGLLAIGLPFSAYAQCGDMTLCMNIPLSTRATHLHNIYELLRVRSAECSDGAPIARGNEAAGSPGATATAKW